MAQIMQKDTITNMYARVSRCLGGRAGARAGEAGRRADCLFAYL